MGEPENWVDRFLKSKIGRYFVRVDQDYIKDQFNTFGLKNERAIDNFKAAYDMVQGRIKPSTSDDQCSPEYERSAYYLYGLIHRRFIQTQQGCKELYEKYEKGEYGKCPLISCHGTYCLPYGTSEHPKERGLCIYCPNCHEVYNAEDVLDSIDGAFFGQSYLMIFFHFYSNKLKINTPIPIELRLFGFKIEDPQLTEDETEEEE